MRKMRGKYSVFIILVALLAEVAGVSFASDNVDFQYWNTESISYKVAKDWKIEAEEEFRFGKDWGKLYYNHSDFGVVYSGLAKWFDLGANYRLVFEKNKKWAYENRPHLNATFKYDLYDFDLSTRNRFEYRMKEKGASSWRYRNKFTIKYLLTLESFNLTPYIADEIFVDFSAGNLNRNRLYGGIGFKIITNLTLDIYYLWQANKKSHHWTYDNVLGTKVKLSF